MVVVIRVKPFGVAGVINSQDAVDDRDAFARESDDAFNDKFVTGPDIEFGVFEYDDLPTRRNVAFVLELIPSNREAVDDNAVTGIERFFHAWPNDVVTSKYIRIDEKRSNKNANNEHDNAKDVFDAGVALKV